MEIEDCVGPGWVPLVKELDRQILELCPNRTISQIKEKFGGLRYYVSLNTEDVGAQKQAWALIADAEAESFRICEQCGAPGTTGPVRTTGFGWVFTLCDTCREERREALRLREASR